MKKDEFRAAIDAGVKKFVVRDGQDSDRFVAGDVLELRFDDGSSAPFFINERTGIETCAMCDRFMSTEDYLKNTIKDAKAQLNAIKKAKEAQVLEEVIEKLDAAIASSTCASYPDSIMMSEASCKVISHFLKELKSKREKEKN